MCGGVAGLPGGYPGAGPIHGLHPAAAAAGTAHHHPEGLLERPPASQVNGHAIISQNIFALSVNIFSSNCTGYFEIQNCHCKIYFYKQFLT